MSSFCEVCEQHFKKPEDREATCIICGQECCSDCIDKFRICRDCDTSGEFLSVQQERLPKVDGLPTKI